MPVQYPGILEEHRAVRETAGLFDLSHMGELFVEGPEAGAALAYALVTDPPALAIGRAHYSMICAPDGGILDDLIVYRLGEERFLVVANAGNAQLVSDTLAERIAGSRAVLDDRSLATALVAIQGPAAVGDPRAAHRRRPRRRSATTRSPRASVAGIPALVARTGYTGEDGFEVFVENARAVRAVGRLLAGGRGRARCRSGSAPATRCGSRRGCRSTATISTATTNPFEAGLGRVVKLDKPGDFVGRAALEQGRPRGVRAASRRPRRRGRGIARHGYPVRVRRAADRRRHERHASRRRSACRSRWPTSHPPTPSRVPWWTSGSATAGSRRGRAAAVLSAGR